jgi:hypothetical protein
MADAVPGHAHAADADLELADLSELDPTRESGDDPIGLEWGNKEHRAVLPLKTVLRIPSVGAAACSDPMVAENEARRRESR